MCLNLFLLDICIFLSNENIKYFDYNINSNVKKCKCDFDKTGAELCYFEY